MPHSKSVQGPITPSDANDLTVLPKAVGNRTCKRVAGLTREQLLRLVAMDLLPPLPEGKLYATTTIEVWREGGQK
jgi:hypothetical protein